MEEGYVQLRQQCDRKNMRKLRDTIDLFEEYDVLEIDFDQIPLEDREKIIFMCGISVGNLSNF